jgi:hypothetical protein
MRRFSAATTLAVALLAGLVAVVVASPATAGAATPCWQRVINQWLNNQPIATTYKPACYNQALKNVPEDLRDYSDITDAINAALQASLRGGGSSGPGTTPSGGSTSPSGNGSTSGGSTNPESKNRSLQNVPSRSLYRQAIDNLGTTKADSLPIPLLVLAGLGTVLLLTAAGLAAHKRLKARPRQPLS